jgi:hypothetical protein
MEAGAVTPSKMSREAALAYLRDEWGWPGLQEIRRYLSTPPRYVAVVNGQHVELGTAENLLNQRRLRLSVFQSTHHLLRWVDQRYWDTIVQVIAQATVDYEAPEAEELDWLVSLLEAYLDAYKPAQEEDESAWKSHVRMELPIERGGSILVHATHLAKWSTEQRGQRIRPREMAYLLRRYGAESVRVALKSSGYVHRRYWALPTPLLSGQGEAETDFTGVARLPLLSGEVATTSAPSSTEKKEGVATLPLRDDSRGEDPKKEKEVAMWQRGEKKRVLNGINPVATSFEGSGNVATSLAQEGMDDDWF